MCVSHMISAALALAAGLSLPVVGRARAFRTPSRPISISNSGAAQRVLVTDGLAPAALDALAAGGADVTSRSLTEDELCAGALAAYDAVIIRSATTLRADALSAGAAGRLRVVGRAGVGVDNIDVAGAHASGVTVVNTPSASTASVVEMTLALLFAAARNLPAADRGLRSGEWLKPPARGSRLGSELAGKNLGLLGFGRIARGVAAAAAALGMRVFAYSPHAASETAAALPGATTPITCAVSPHAPAHPPGVAAWRDSAAVGGGAVLHVLACLAALRAHAADAAARRR